MPQLTSRSGRPAPVVPLLQQRCKVCKPASEIPLPEDFLSFGPVYRPNEGYLRERKDEAWDHALDRTDAANPEQVKNSYIEALRGIPLQEYYGDAIHNREGHEMMMMMMIKDSCLFLQLVIHILEGPGGLGYADGDPMFGRESFNQNKKRWIKSMLFIGNQIPFEVLHKLMRQEFFKNIINKMKLERPSSLIEIALYELLLFGLFDSESEGTWDKLKRRRSLRGVLQRLQQRKIKPSNLIHSLQLLILGEELQDTEDRNDGEHVVVNVRLDCPIDNVKVLRNKKGIRFQKDDKIGSRGIHFGRDWLFRFHVLYLPKFIVDEYTEQVLISLVDYEKVQHKKEVISYIKLMSELITDPSDAKILHDQGIIDADLHRRGTLAGILRRVITGATQSSNMLRVRLQINEHSRTRYWTDYLNQYKNLIAMLGLIFTILSYHQGQILPLQGGKKNPSPPF